MQFDLEIVKLSRERNAFHTRAGSEARAKSSFQLAVVSACQQKRKVHNLRHGCRLRGVLLRGDRHRKLDAAQLVHRDSYPGPKPSTVTTVSGRARLGREHKSFM